MKYQLFISGTPTDYELFPQGDAHASQYCKQFFNLPTTETFHSADYYVELFPGERLAYYTLMHRRNVSSTRENAYVALTLQFTGCYVEDIKAVFSLLETVYNNYVVGNATEIVGNGEKYRMSSLAVFDSLRAKAETELVSTLNLLSKSVKEFDASFSTKRQQISKQLWYLDESNRLLSKEMRAAHRLHLIPTSDGFEDVVNQANGQIATLNDRIINLTNTNNELNDKLSSASQTIKEKEDTYYKLMKSYTELEDKLKTMPKPTPDDVFKNRVLQKLNTIENNISEMQPTFSGRARDWKKWLLWGLLAIGVVIIAILGWRVFNFENSESSLRWELSELKNQYKELQISYNKLELQRNAIQSEYESYRQKHGENLFGQNSSHSGIAENGSDTNPFSIGGRNDKNFFVGKSYKLSYKTKPKGFDHWEIFQGKENGKIDSDNLYCSKEGSITIGGADKEGNPLDGFIRTIQIENKNHYDY